MLNYLLLLTIFSITANAAPSVGKIIKMAGKATYMDTVTKKPVAVKAGRLIKDDSSLYVYKNSYVTIKLINELSFIKIGHNSKISLRYVPEDKKYLVYVHSGYMKALFKSTEAVQDMVVYTQQSTVTASGSKFIVVSNPLTKGTTVFNYKGDVQIQDRNITLDKTPVPPQKYTYMDAKNPSPSRPHFINAVRQKELSEIFDLEKKAGANI
jgi:hypothetical protein